MNQSNPEDAKRTSVRYEKVDSEYFQKRQLQRKANFALLWALGVGAVISGDYFGWNYGLLAGGFWGLAVATVLMAIMYCCMVYCIAELTTALPHAGGFYSFTRSAFGPWGGFLVGITDTIEYIVTPSVIVVGIGGYLNALVPDIPLWLWWFVSYMIFVGINIRGVEITLKVGMVLTVISIALLLLFYGGAIVTGAFRWELLFTVPADPGQSSGFLPRGWLGVIASLPYAIWFYLAIEELPLAAEETVDVAATMPRALILGVFTLFALSLGTMILNSGVNGGAVVIGNSPAPLNEGFRAIFGEGATTTLLTFVALAGLVASFHTIIYAYGRVLFALSRAGYLPRWLSATSSRFKTPHLALVMGGLVGFLTAVLLDVLGKGFVGAALLNMAVFGAVISYAAVMISFIKLRIERPELPRPYRSPLGIPGAVVGTVLALIALGACFANSDYLPGVYGVAFTLVVFILYFTFYSRHRLVAQAPEEEIALMAEAGRKLRH